MPSTDTYAWAEAMLGEHIQYPGHPLVLACMIMDRYPDFALATEISAGAEFSNAQRDSFLPGTGCAVTAALTTLRLAAEKGESAAIAHAAWYWDGWERQSTANGEKASRGRAQAAKVRPAFLARLKVWGSDQDHGSVYRTACQAREPRYISSTAPCPLSSR